MIERAKKIILAADSNGGNICIVDGMMVGIPIVQAARRLLGRARNGPRELLMEAYEDTVEATDVPTSGHTRV
jgi:hypothetical protein